MKSDWIVNAAFLRRTTSFIYVARWESCLWPYLSIGCLGCMTLCYAHFVERYWSRNCSLVLWIVREGVSLPTKASPEIFITAARFWSFITRLLPGYIMYNNIYILVPTELLKPFPDCVMWWQISPATGKQVHKHLKPTEHSIGFHLKLTNYPLFLGNL